MKTPIVSICCVTYNHIHFLKECLEGFLMQKTSFPIEILIHDDASTDGTTELIKAYETKYPELINPVYQKENQFSKGKKITPILMSKAKGKYIALCEGDDYWTDPLKLQKQVDFLVEHSDYTGCFHYTQTIKENGELGRMFGQIRNKIDFDPKDTFSTLALLHTSSFVFLRSALESPVWLSKIVSGDMALFSIIGGKGRLRCLPEEMSIYRKHEGGITSTPNILNNFHSQRIELMEYLNEFHNYKYQKAADAVIEYHRMALNANSKKIGLFYKIIQKAKKIIHG